jgi:tetratricopeptide (TPR) repeat protein
MADIAAELKAPALYRLPFVGFRRECWAFQEQHVAEISKSDAGFLGQFEPDVFWEQHGRKIIAGLVAVLAVGLAIVYWRSQRAEEEQQAAARLAVARDPISLQAIIQAYPGKMVAAQALLRLADAYFQEVRLAEAASTYQQFLSSFPQDGQVPAALLGLAAVQEAGGNLEAAKGQYFQLVSSRPDAYTAIAAKLGAARCAMKLGQKKEARQLYEELMPVVQGTQWQMETQLGWTLLLRDTEPSSPATVGAPVVAPTTGLELKLPDAATGPPAVPVGEKAP